MATALARRPPVTAPAAVLLGRFSAPRPAADAVARPRLHRLLDEGVARGVVVVSAPPGSGKTWLLAAWSPSCAAGTADVAWVSLDPVDTDPGRFVRSVTRAIASCSAAGAAAMGDLVSPPPQRGLDVRYLAAVAEAIGRLPRDVVVVLDDFQEVAGSETERLVARLLRFLPARLRVVLLSRERPEVGQARLRLAGQLAELGAADLAFTVDEARALLGGAAEALGEDDLRRLVELTEGWAAALRLAALSLEEGGDATSVLTRLVSGDTLVDEFVRGEILGRQPAEVQDLLLRACIVERVCGDLADALTGRDDGARMLADLHRANLFLVALDRTGTWYRWQSLFRAMLLRRLSTHQAGLAPGLHRVAAGWFHAHGHPLEAVAHAVAAGDTALGAQVVGECWLDLLVAGEVTALRGLLERFDEECRATHAELAVASAFVAFEDADADMTLRLARRAVELAPSLPPRRGLAVEVMATVVRLLVATMSGRDPEGEAHHAALRLLGRLEEPGWLPSRIDRLRRGALLYAAGAFETAMLDWQPAEAHLREALATGRATGLVGLELSCLAQLASHDFRNGRLERGRAAARRVVDTADDRGWAGYHNLVTAFDNLGGTAVLRDEVEAALQHLAGAARLVRPLDMVNRFNVSFLLGVALRRAGRRDAARVELDRLRAVVAGWTSPPAWTAASLATAEADQLACDGHPDAALRRLERVEAPGPGASVTRPFAAVHAELLVRCGRAEDALRLLEGHPEEGPRPFRTAALVAGALAAEALGRRQAALDGVEEALRAAEEERILHPFVAAGADMATLLRALLERGTTLEPFALDVLARLAPASGSRAQSAGEYVPPLSPRELQVLRQLQGTLRNHEIAARLFVSSNTLKSHIRSINQKLGTTRRREAVARARRLGIL